MSIMMIDPRQQVATAEESTGRKRKQRSKIGNQADAPNKCAQEDSRTTVMLRNLPRDFSRDALLKLLDEHGFEGKYNFAYMPIDFVRQAGLGYAFVNLCTPAAAQEFWRAFDGFSAWPVACDKVCRVNWSSPHQGYEEHVQRYRNSPMMHKDVPDACRPVLLENGVRVEFPAPTKSLRPPRLRAARQHCPFWDQEQQEEFEADGEAQTKGNDDC
jgi:RNA recognition motif-containing protein